MPGISSESTPTFVFKGGLWVLGRTSSHKMHMIPTDRFRCCEYTGSSHFSDQRLSFIEGNSKH
ncbi:hypothetical protein AG1IA_03158 [Rhizoctonia solani AG-1 IA]|uniref:Uncharacterized protein n=1 Tax=Thanatephorus cucumeris (strain AG1-IA) TaxID=983506 RepID=L8X2I1_THACA|nr:hypothetical protein AG1IA_03158 [Rhizoctonia solani AG-1 IA]